MAQVNVVIDGKQFRMACDDGQESHLEALATHLDDRIRMMRQSFGEIGDLRLTVMAALMVCDELVEEKRRSAAIQANLDADRSARSRAAEGDQQRDAAVAGAIDQMTARVERITRMLATPQMDA